MFPGRGQEGDRGMDGLAGPGQCTHLCRPPLARLSSLSSYSPGALCPVLPLPYTRPASLPFPPSAMLRSRGWLLGLVLFLLRSASCYAPLLVTLRLLLRSAS